MGRCRHATADHSLETLFGTSAFLQLKKLLQLYILLLSSLFHNTTIVSITSVLAPLQYLAHITGRLFRWNPIGGLHFRWPAVCSEQASKSTICKPLSSLHEHLWLESIPRDPLQISQSYSC